MLAVCLFVAGFAISPTMVATMSLVEECVPASRLTEGITWFSTGIAFGIAPGAAIAGHLIDEYGTSTAFLVPIASGVIAAAVAWLATPAAAPSASSAESGDRSALAEHGLLGLAWPTYSDTAAPSVTSDSATPAATAPAELPQTRGAASADRLGGRGETESADANSACGRRSCADSGSSD